MSGRDRGSSRPRGPARARRAQRSRQRRGDGPGLSQQVFVLYAAVLLLVAGSGVIVALVAADRLARHGAEDRVLSVAQAVAATPDVQAALATPDPAQELQPLAERIRREANVSFVVVMSPGGTRFSHPNPEMKH